MILPLRIKGKEYPLSKGDIVVCITESFQEFTSGLSLHLFTLYIAIKVDENDTEQIKNTVQFHNDFLSHLGTLSSDGL